MSAPNSDLYAQPSFSQTASPAGIEPTNDELDRMSKLTQVDTRNKGVDRLAVSVASGMLLALIGSGVLLVASLAASTTPTATSSPVAPSSLCERGQVEVETVQGDVRTDSYCATQAEYEALVAEAESQYAAALKASKFAYQDWLTDHKLSPETEEARETTAQEYLCQEDPEFGDAAALYAATQAGLPEGELDVAIGNALITIDGYDPLDQWCENGKPAPRPNPNPPKPSLQPKDPYSNPEPSVVTNEWPGQPGEVEDP